ARGKVPDGLSGAGLRDVSSDARTGRAGRRRSPAAGGQRPPPTGGGRAMNKRGFVQKREASWRRFEQLLERLDAVSLQRFSPGETAEFSRLFRELCHDLSLTRSRDGGGGLVAYLNALVSRGHNAFYSGPRGKLASIGRFLAIGFPRLFRANLGYFVAAAA